MAATVETLIDRNGTKARERDLPTPRPLSVSASDHLDPAEKNNKLVDDHNGFVTPRVLDQRAFDELSRTLRELVKDARTATAELSETISGAEQRDRDAVRSAEHLQEQVRLSARLLKAMQVQAESLQSVSKVAEQSSTQTEALRELFDNKSKEIDRRVASILAGVETRVNEIIEKRVEEMLKARCEQLLAARKVALLSEVENRLAELQQPAERVCQMVETAEVNIAALAHRSALSVRQAEETAEKCTELSAAMELSASEQKTAIESLLNRADATLQSWSEILEDLERTVGNDGKITNSNLPAEEVRAMVEQFRDSIGHDVRQLQQSVQRIANQIHAIGEKSDNASPRLLNSAQRAPSMADGAD